MKCYDSSTMARPDALDQGSEALARGLTLRDDVQTGRYDECADQVDRDKVSERLWDLHSAVFEKVSIEGDNLPFPTLLRDAERRIG